MPFQAVPNTIQCDVLFMYYGQRVENVFHVEVPGGVDAAVIVDTANDVRDWVIDSYLPLLVTAVSFIGVEAKNLSIEGGGTAFALPPGSASGGSAGEGMPGGTAFAVSLKTASSGRSYRGRKFVFGLNRSQISGNQIAIGYAGDIVAAFNELIAILTAVSKVLVIVSRIADGVERLTGVTTPVTTAAFTNLDVDSQRRRLTGRGS
jgi:hypothetical protein